MRGKVRLQIQVVSQAGFYIKIKLSRRKRIPNPCMNILKTIACHYTAKLIGLFLTIFHLSRSLKHGRIVIGIALVQEHCKQMIDTVFSFSHMSLTPRYQHVCFSMQLFCKDLSRNQIAKLTMCCLFFFLSTQPIHENSAESVRLLPKLSWKFLKSSSPKQSTLTFS